MTPVQIIQMAIIAAIILLLALSIMLAEKKSSKKKEKRIITFIRCDRGDSTSRRDFKPGDFVGKIEGKCPKCGSTLRVYSIYVEEVEV